MMAGIYVNIGSGNGLLPDDTNVDLSSLKSSDVHLAEGNFAWDISISH